jgi:predicted transcriptional regulator
MTYKTGSIGQFMAWTKQVIRDPKAAKGVPKRWFDSEATARAALGREVSTEAMVKLLSPQNRRLLSIIASKRPRSVQELANLTGRKQASVSRTLKRLAQAGIVSLTRSERRTMRPQIAATRVQLEIDLTGTKGKGFAEESVAASSDIDAAWLTSYATNVVDAFRSRFDGATDRFADGQRLLVRFQEAVALVFRGGKSRFRKVDETHNELCVAAAILANSDPRFVSLEYEPRLEGSKQTIDFRARTEQGRTVYVDVKTIKPEPKDRWDQFERALKEHWLPDSVRVVVSKKWQGGEIWHRMFAARAAMLTYTKELEAKIAKIGPNDQSATFVLALCGEGFYWHEDELEDFASFYRSGVHRSDDPFGTAEAHSIARQGTVLQRTVSMFACMRRSFGEPFWTRLNWNVQPPREPTL